MTRFLMAALAAAAGFGATATAGGPPPVYVVVDKVELEPSADAPDRIKIAGSFVRLEDVDRYKYGKPAEGYVYLGLPAGKEAEARAEWKKLRQAAGTGKVVAVGSCGEAGALLTAKVHKPDDRPAKPDAAYAPGHLGSLDAARSYGREAPVRDLLAFVEKRSAAAKTAGGTARP